MYQNSEDKENSSTVESNSSLHMTIQKIIVRISLPMLLLKFIAKIVLF